ncbi:MAG TPA: class I SAM-dependent methyltransferase [Blastocatellia bacterium]|nr:class I SAM-dependent methyltransferase [Blastocatellia bacterium]
MGLYAKYIFPRLMDWGLKAPAFHEQRRIALAPAKGRTLEIGFGTGLNLAHYPEAVTHLTVIDSERMLPQKVADRIRRAPMPVEVMQLDASGRLPFEDASFDTVVSTWTLCSIADLPAALAQVRRVLKPDGQFIFLEHGRSDDPKVAKRQDLLNPLQRLIGAGCNMNRPIDRLIKEAGFEIVALDRFLLPDTPRMLGEMYRGIARPGTSG